MTRWFAEAFGEVHAFDVSPRMIEAAQARLSGCPNVHFHPSTGRDLAPLPDASVDLVFSYIVFQHIPSREVIENYVREAARVLRPDGALKFQVNGGPEQPAQPDTWLGVTFSCDEIRLMLEQPGFRLLGVEGAGTQYFVLTAKKSLSSAAFILPGEPSAASMLLTGWGAAVDQSWRPVHAHAAARLPVPVGANRFFLGLYGWPGTNSRLTVRVDAVEIGCEAINAAGDVFVEWNCAPAGASATVTLDFSPSCPRLPAVRCLGLYAKK
jgi:SAM-dependent methyltransferase